MLTGFSTRQHHGRVRVVEVEADYLVVGAGAFGMAFTDALVDHADVSVVMVDRRHAAGGHWLDAYPFVRLHQASSFYGVASTPLGDGSVQRHGPETGLHERATAPEICAYYGRVLHERLIGSGRVTFHPGCDHLGGGRFVSRVSGQVFQMRSGARLVDARYLAPAIPATTPAPFGVAAGVSAVPVNDLVNLGHAPSQYVVVGAGKTATDACVWLLENGVDPGAICWVRPREPWMLNRASVQPDPAVFYSTAADIMAAAAAATTADDVFFRLEDAGVMLRLEESVTPTMAKVPTIAEWEVDRLRTIDRVVRLGHLRTVERGRLVLDGGSVPIAPDAVVVHCVAPGLQYPPLVPIWGSAAITLQPIRSGFPCFGAALAGYVEATLTDDDAKNRLCPPSPFADTTTGWARQQVLGARANLTAHTGVREWADQVLLNPGRVAPELAGSSAVGAARERLGRHAGAGMARLAEFAGLADR